MTGPAAPDGSKLDEALTEHLRYQLSCLDAYERLLDARLLDDAQLNELLKAGLSVGLSLIKVATVVKGEAIELQKRLIRRCRRHLEEALRRREARRRRPADGGPPRRRTRRA